MNAEVETKPFDFGVSTIWHRWLRVPYTLHVYRHSVSEKRPRATLVFLHGIGNSGPVWDIVAAELPDNVDVIIVDLLGFGDSPRPTWATYNARTQARSLMKTLLGLRLKQQIVLVGHSMGSLVAVEFAKKYPLLVKSLVLCSPPLYNLELSGDKKVLLQRDELLRSVYELALKDPANFVRLSTLALKAGMKSPDFDITKLDGNTYAAALKANIINQTTMQDIVKLKRPIRILYGTLDPFVIGKNIRKVQKASPNVTVMKFIGGHEIVGSYVERVAKAIKQQIGEVIA